MPDVPAFKSPDEALAAFRARYNREPVSDYERDYFAVNGRIPGEVRMSRPAPRPIPSGYRDPSDGSRHYPTFAEMFPTPLRKPKPPTT